jgi:hypothetical protein
MFHTRCSCSRSSPTEHLPLQALSRSNLVECKHCVSTMCSSPAAGRQADLMCAPITRRPCFTEAVAAAMSGAGPICTGTLPHCQQRCWDSSLLFERLRNWGAASGSRRTGPCLGSFLCCRWCAGVGCRLDAAGLTHSLLCAGAQVEDTHALQLSAVQLMAHMAATPAGRSCIVAAECLPGLLLLAPRLHPAVQQHLLMLPVICQLDCTSLTYCGKKVFSSGCDTGRAYAADWHTVLMQQVRSACLISLARAIARNQARNASMHMCICLVCCHLVCSCPPGVPLLDSHVMRQSLH